MSTRICSVEDRKGLQSKQNKKVLQSNQDKKIRLDKKLSSNDEFSSLIGKCNKYRESKCKIASLVKKDWTNLEKKSFDRIGLARQTRLLMNTCF